MADGPPHPDDLLGPLLLFNVVGSQGDVDVSALSPEPQGLVRQPGWEGGKGRRSWEGNDLIPGGQGQWGVFLACSNMMLLEKFSGL